MIVLIHTNNKIIKVLQNNILLEGYTDRYVTEVLFEIASNFTEEILYWVSNEIYNQNNYSQKIDIKPFEIFTYNTSRNNFLSDEIGYVDFKSPLLNINKDVKYATWLLSADIGLVYSKSLLIYNILSNEKDFSYFLVNLGKMAIKSGLFCYSTPELIINKSLSNDSKKCSKTKLFKFVKRHYTFKKYIFLFLVYVYYKREFPFVLFIRNLFKKQYLVNNLDVSKLFDNIEHSILSMPNYDVIIPTLGRASHLHNFLNDLNKQTIFPQNVIIVEQINDQLAITELPFLKNEKWNFKIIHKIINQLGACNARNLAIDEVKSEWVFFADDDIRIDKSTLENALTFLINSRVNGASLASYKLGESINKSIKPFFWNEFSSGCSIIKSKFVINNYFDMKYEFGFGEDTDYGCKLRRNGCSLLYYNQVPVFHLKAPIGGFRTIIKKKWSHEIIQPFPEPTVVKCVIENFSSFQFDGFRLHYIIKGFKIRLQKIKFDLSVKYALDIK